MGARRSTPQLPVKGDFCTAGKCKRARAALLASKKMCVVGVAAGGAALFAEDDGSQCFEVYAMYGVSRCDISKLGAVQRRNELEKKDEHWSYEVYGKFGMTEDDNGYGALPPRSRPRSRSRPRMRECARRGPRSAAEPSRRWSR